MQCNKICKVLTAIAALVLITVINIFVCTTVSVCTFIQLLSNGTDKYVAFGVAILIAFGLYFYIGFNHKIREFIIVYKGNTSI